MLLNAASAAVAEDSTASLQTAFLEGQYETVLTRVHDLLERERTDHPDELLYLQGVSALKLHNLELAQASLQRLRSDYPNSRWVPQASGALKAVSAAASEIYFSVQVGAFETKANAARLRAALEKRGYEGDLSETLIQGQRFYRVRVGRFSNRSEAEEEVQRLKGDGFPGEVVP